MAAKLPGYVASAKPLPMANRVPWYASIAPTYAGVMLWFVFWQDVPLGASLHPTAAGGVSAFAGGILAHGLGLAFLGLILAALICHFLFYLAPALLGMKTGLPLYIVGTSTYGVQGGFIMPGLVMGLLQFGWLAVNAFFSAQLLCAPWGEGAASVAQPVVATVWAAAAAFMGLMGIQYVARVATFFPLIPLAILVILFVSVVGNVGQFDSGAMVTAQQNVEVVAKSAEGEVQTLRPSPPLSAWQLVSLITAYIVGFFATAGAAGADIAMNSRDEKHVQLGGLVGIALATIVAGGLSLLIAAGVHGGKPTDSSLLRTTALMADAMGSARTADIFMYLLAIAAFPAACFSAFIAANSFKSTMPQINPYVSVGVGALISIVLAVSGVAGDAAGVFTIIGASFGPVCGSMTADYLLAGRRWAGPRAGFNPAGWVAWVLGFVVGASNFIPGLEGLVPCPPVAAFLVGFVVYVILAKLGAESATLAMPTAPQHEVARP